MTKRSLLGVLGLALLPGLAEAQTYGYVNFVGVGDSFIASFLKSNNSALAAFAGAPYEAKFSIDGTDLDLPPHGTPPVVGSPPGNQSQWWGPVVDILCIDFLHTANTGGASPYDAWFTNVANDDLDRARGKDRDEYAKVVWLARQMEDTPLVDQATRVDLHVAMWYLLTGEPVGGLVGVPGSSPTWSTGYQSWVAQANVNYASADNMGNLQNWSIVTDDCVGVHETGQFSVADGCGQEFLVRTGSDVPFEETTVPEPGTMILLGTGLAGLVHVRRRRNRDAE